MSAFDQEKTRIDAVVLDIVMPIMAASELLPQMKERQPQLKVLLTSGYSESEARRLCARISRSGIHSEAIHRAADRGSGGRVDGCAGVNLT